jgi:hypothetical protein
MSYSETGAFYQSFKKKNKEKFHFWRKTLSVKTPVNVIQAVVDDPPDKIKVRHFFLFYLKSSFHFTWIIFRHDISTFFFYWHELATGKHTEKKALLPSLDLHRQTWNCSTIDQYILTQPPRCDQKVTGILILIVYCSVHCRSMRAGTTSLVFLSSSPARMSSSLDSSELSLILGAFLNSRKANIIT